MIDKIKKHVVLANYRTGSTALCDILARHNKIINLDEYFHPVAIKNRKNNINDYETWMTPGYLIKVMPDQIIEPYFSDLISRADNVVGIYRKDVAAQIASYYVACHRNVWHNKNNDNNPEYEFNFDESSLRKVIDQITKLNKVYIETFRPLCKQELVYEEVKSLLLCASDYKLYKRPSNYPDIIETINRILAEEPK